jgi:16S rRNA (cytosine967-C5)-methyltransferase
MHPKTIARRAALLALQNLENEDAPLAAALGTALRTAGVPGEMRAFARELTSGVLRHRAWLDWTLEPLLKTPLEKLDVPVRVALRLAAYERAWLETPASAVANEYAGLMKQARLSSATGFVNAVARRLPSQPRELPAGWPLAQRIAVEFSHPQWLVERWLARWGELSCAQLCHANNQIAPLNLRVNTLQSGREEVLEKLLARDLKVRRGTLSPDAIRVEEGGAPDNWPEWKSGDLIAQDEAAQLVGLLAAPVPGSLVIDCAAAPGGKTTHLAQLMDDKGLVIACDAAPGRVKLVEENARRLHLDSIAARAGDLRALAAALPKADLVLLDAPCLGTGTLRRRPDAKHRKTAEQLEQLAQLQSQLLGVAATLVKPGGALIYSTCSLEREENEEQVRKFLEENAGWRVADDYGALPPETISAVGTPDGFLQTLPHIHDCDGMFAAKLVRE